MRTPICASRQRRAALAAVAALLALTAAPTVQGIYVDNGGDSCHIIDDTYGNTGLVCHYCTPQCCWCLKGQVIDRFFEGWSGGVPHCRKKCSQCAAGKSTCSHRDTFGSGDGVSFMSCGGPYDEYTGLCPHENTGSCQYPENKPFNDVDDGTGWVKDYCAECGAGFYANGPHDHEGRNWMTSVCTECPTGTFNAWATSAYCDKCPRGKFQGWTGRSYCYSCAAGKHTTTTGEHLGSNCVSCPAGKVSGSGSICTACIAGKKANAANTACESCGVNEYSSAQSDSCTACGAGHYTTGATYLHGPTGCSACPAGKFSATALTAASQCTTCPEGFYCTGGNAKVSCAAGSTSPAGSDASGNCNACTSGWREFNTVGACGGCAAGKYFLAGIGCPNCAAGKFSPTVGATAESTCQPCSGVLNSLPGSTSASDCVSCDPNVGEYSCYSRCDSGDTCAQCHLPLTITTADRADGTTENVCGECPPESMALAPNPLAGDGEFNDAADITLEWHIDLYDAALPFRENDGMSSSKSWQTTGASGCVGVRPGFARLKKYAPFYNLETFARASLDIPGEVMWILIDGSAGKIRSSYHRPFAVDAQGNTRFLGLDFGWCQRIPQWYHDEYLGHDDQFVDFGTAREPPRDNFIKYINWDYLDDYDNSVSVPLHESDCLFAVQDFPCRPPFYCEADAFVAVQCDNEDNAATGSCGRIWGKHGEILTSDDGAASSMMLCPSEYIVLTQQASSLAQCEPVPLDESDAEGSITYIAAMTALVWTDGWDVSDVWQGAIEGHMDRQERYISLLDKDRLNSLYVNGKYYCNSDWWGIHPAQYGSDREGDGVIKEDFSPTNSLLRTPSTPLYTPPCEFCGLDPDRGQLYKPPGNALDSRRCEQCNHLPDCESLTDYDFNDLAQIRLGCGGFLFEDSRGICGCGLKRKLLHMSVNRNTRQYHICYRCANQATNNFKVQVLNAPNYMTPADLRMKRDNGILFYTTHRESYDPAACSYCPPGFNSFECPDDGTDAINDPDHACQHCHPCAAGTRSPDGVAACLDDCPEITNAMTKDQITGSSVTVDLFSYTAVAATECATCGAGYYFEAGIGPHGQCLQCEAGEYNLAEGVTPGNALTARTPSECTVCPDTCTDETYMESCNPETASPTCIDIPPCATGEYWSSVQKSCTACASCQAGHQRMNCGNKFSGTCVSCTHGFTYITSAYTTCQDCLTPDAGNGFRQACTTTSAGTIQQCDVGTWGPDPSASNGCTACNGCPAGQHNPCCSSPSGVEDDFAAIFCTKYEASDPDGACDHQDLNCKNNGYSADSSVADTCVPCPAGFYKTEGPADADNHRLSCRSCAERLYTSFGAGACLFNHRLAGCGGSSAGTCAACSASEYHDCASDTCVSVPLQSRRVTSASVASCGDQQGHELVLCGENAIDRPNPDHAEECFCQLNYKLQVHADTLSQSCQPCGTSTFGDSITTDGVARSVCTSCPAYEGHNLLAQPASACRCNPGYTGKRKPGDDTKYSGDAGCSACPAGTFKQTRSTNDHTIADNDVPAADECTPCSGGTVATLQGSITCEQCPAGSFCPPGSAVPIPCPDGKTSAAGSDNEALCQCASGQTLSASTGVCTLDASVCAAGSYAHVEACSASAAAAGEPTLAAALETSNPGLTPDEVWHIDLLRRVDWMQQQGARQRVHSEVMPAPDLNGKARLAVVYEFGMYEAFCSTFGDGLAMALRLTHTKTAASNQFWDCDTASGSCTLPQIEVQDMWMDSYENVLVSTISTAQAYYTDYKYVLVDMGDAASLRDPTLPVYTAAQWTMALIHCCSSVVDVGQLSNYPVVSGSEYDETGPFYAQCVLPDARAQIEAVMDTCALRSGETIADCATATGAHARFSAHVGGSVAAVTDHTDYTNNIHLMPHECKSREPNAAIRNCVLNVKIYKDMGTEFIASADSWKHAISFRSTPPRQVAGWLRAPGRQEFAQSTLVDIEYCAPPSDSSAYPGSVYNDLATPQCKHVITPAFVPSAAASTGAIFETSTHTYGEVDSHGTPPTFLDCDYTQAQPVAHKSNRLCLASVPTAPFDPKMRSTGSGLQCADTCDLSSIICDCDIQHCLTAIGSMLVHPPLRQESAAIVEGPYYHALRSGRDSATAAQHSKYGEARYENLEALGVIIEGRQFACDAHASPVQERLYLPFDKDTQLDPDHSHIRDACTAPDTPTTLQGALEGPSACPDSVCLFNTARAYFAQLRLPSERTQVRMRTWTAYALGPYSGWRDLESWQRGSCAHCPPGSSSPFNSAACTDCECDAGQGYLESVLDPGCPACAPCPSGTYKDAPGNVACVECNPADNEYWVTPPGATAFGDCVRNDAEVPTTLPNFDHNGLSASAEPLVLCVNFDTARAAALAVPPELVENRCAAINVCASSHTPGPPSLAPDTWHHREHVPFSLESVPVSPGDDTYDTLDTLYNHHSLEYARIPRGVTLRTCVPDFDHYRTTGAWACDPATERAFAGACDISNLAASALAASALACVQSVQHDATPPTQPTTANPLGATQLFRFALDADHTCAATAPAQRRFVAAPGGGGPLTWPAAHQPCAAAAVVHGSLAADCALVCDPGYRPTSAADDCEPAFGADFTAACTGFQRASDTFTDGAFQRFRCAPCTHVPGESSGEWDPASPTVCQTAPCPAGHVTAHAAAPGLCAPCPPHHYQLDNACAPCDLAAGLHQPTPGSDACVPCEWGNTQVVQASAHFMGNQVTITLGPGTTVIRWPGNNADHPVHIAPQPGHPRDAGYTGTDYALAVHDELAYTTTVTIPAGTPPLYYYCRKHSHMHGSITIDSATPAPLTCAPGSRLVTDAAAAAAFLAQYSGFPDRSQAWCAAGAACLPCPPGHFELASTCQPCPLGTYQNNFAQPACEPCGAGQTTLSTASTSAACVCAPGAAAHDLTHADEDWKLAEQASVDWLMPDAITATKVLARGNARFAHQFFLLATLHMTQHTKVMSWASPIFASAHATVAFAFDASADATLIWSTVDGVDDGSEVAANPEWPGLLALNPACRQNSYRAYVQTYKMITLAEAQATYQTICAHYDTRPHYLGVCCVKSDGSSNNCEGTNQLTLATVISAGGLPPQLYVQYPTTANDLGLFWDTLPRPAWLSAPQNIRQAGPADSCSSAWHATKSDRVALHAYLPSTMLVLWEAPANRGYGDEFDSCGVQNPGQITAGRPGCDPTTVVVDETRGGNAVTAYDVEVTTALLQLLFQRTCTTTDTLSTTDIQALPHAPAFPAAWCHFGDRLAAVSGLTRGQHYYVRMRAHFKYGSSDWSPRALVLFAPQPCAPGLVCGPPGTSHPD